MSEGMIPEERFKTEVEKRKTAEDQRKALTEQVAELSSKLKSATKERDQFAAQVEGIGDLRSELETARGEIATTSSTSAAHIAMLEAGVRSQSVREFMLYQHNQHKAAEGDKAKQWGDWWTGQLEAPPEVLQAHLAGTPTPAAEQPAQAAAPAAQQQPARPQPAANNGAQPAPPPAQRYAPGSIASMSTAEFKANRDQILADLGNTWSG